ncbi:hypothetical protein BDN70DRAFT_871259 [Pholiota conissans]|uniref:Uncharacterized protein n=1 Tax=Pholiota conissans TaxID=109636 RepID=A0A9P6D780_9AGAR|nr:hypothetical protein BDN70DRAFT_871259 [Pholiota conissans]
MCSDEEQEHTPKAKGKGKEKAKEKSKEKSKEKAPPTNFNSMDLVMGNLQLTRSLLNLAEQRLQLARLKEMQVLLLIESGGQSFEALGPQNALDLAYITRDTLTCSKEVADLKVRQHEVELIILRAEAKDAAESMEAGEAQVKAVEARVKEDGLSIEASKDVRVLPAEGGSSSSQPAQPEAGPSEPKGKAKATELDLMNFDMLEENDDDGAYGVGGSIGGADEYYDALVQEVLST